MALPLFHSNSIQIGAKYVTTDFMAYFYRYKATCVGITEHNFLLKAQYI